jgi:hypothetical protein
MEKRSFSFIALLSLTLVFLTFNSCKKEDTNTDTEDPITTTPSYQSATDNSKAENLFNGAFKQVSQYSVVVDTGAKFSSKSYPILTISGSGYPKTFTLDYGTHTVCEDGRTRSGLIITELSAPYLDSATVVLSHFSNYYETVNNIDYHLNGTHTVVNLGHINAGHPYYSVKVDSASVVSPAGTIQWNSLRYREFTAGYDTWFNPFDDAYTITGSANGIDLNGEAFTVTITEGLQVRFDCPFIKVGKIEVINPTRPIIYIDYGTGDCDANFTVTVNGYTINIVAG